MIRQPITMLTGQMGHGKTLYAMAIAEWAQKEGRQVYQLGINGCDPTFIPELPVPLERWMELPEGSVIILDECHKDGRLPQRGPGKPPQWIEVLAESRHKGIYWVMITQSPGSFDHFVRKRVGVHMHIERKAGLPAALIFSWERAMDPEDFHAREQAQKTVWYYPKHLYGKYTSAKDHYVKTKIPWKIWAVPVFAIFCCWVIWNLVSTFDGFGEATAAPQPAAPGQLADMAAPNLAGPVGRNRPAVLDPAAWIINQAPVVEGIPWSAPIFQGRPIRSEPEVFCGVFGQYEDAKRSRCRCISEQGTTLSIPTVQCRAIARHGLYNPYRAPDKEPERAAPEKKA